MDIYAVVTDRIIAQLENNIVPWRKPWLASNQAVSRTTGKPYSLLNQMLLGRPGEYLTFSQCQKEGGKIKKGEKAQIVVFWKRIETEDEETHEKKEVPFLRYYNVFHVDQCEGITAKHDIPIQTNIEPEAQAEQIIASYLDRSGVKLIHREGDRAFYSPASDSISIPLRSQFSSIAEYYGTAFHELSHSTGHISRLNRLEKTAFFDSEAYSKEELTAEIAASALVNHCGLETSNSFRNSAAYIQSWLSVLRGDKRFIMSASGKAEKAVALILNSQD
ncbi:MAG: DUF1738 domain-containing protein [Clostridia bacterium]|nr:DUF1738 domain-containing protein [Clostridia bacterium]